MPVSSRHCLKARVGINLEPTLLGASVAWLATGMHHHAYCGLLGGQLRIMRSRLS